MPSVARANTRAGRAPTSTRAFLRAGGRLWVVRRLFPLIVGLALIGASLAATLSGCAGVSTSKPLAAARPILDSRYVAGQPRSDVIEKWGEPQASTSWPPSDADPARDSAAADLLSGSRQTISWCDTFFVDREAGVIPAGAYADYVFYDSRGVVMGSRTALRK